VSCFLSSSLRAIPGFDMSPDMATTLLLDTEPCLENNFSEKKKTLICSLITENDYYDKNNNNSQCA
jgi:hypothetical protein